MIYAHEIIAETSCTTSTAIHIMFQQVAMKGED